MHSSDPCPPTAWHPRLWVIGVAVIGLHALAFKAIEHVTTGWETGRDMASQPMGFVSVRMKQASPFRHPLADASAKLSSGKKLAPVALPEGAVGGVVTASTVRAASVAGSSEVPPPRSLPIPNKTEVPPRFYSFDEVAEPAEPASEADWNLDPSLLDGAGVARLVFEIYVSDSGEVLAVTVLEPASMEAGFQRLLEYRLRQAKLKPATRAGVAVASTRQIEMFRLGTLSGP